MLGDTVSSGFDCISRRFSAGLLAVNPGKPTQECSQRRRKCASGILETRLNVFHREPKKAATRPRQACIERQSREWDVHTPCQALGVSESRVLPVSAAQEQTEPGRPSYGEDEENPGGSFPERELRRAVDATGAEPAKHKGRNATGEADHVIADGHHPGAMQGRQAAAQIRSIYYPLIRRSRLPITSSISR